MGDSPIAKMTVRMQNGDSTLRENTVKKLNGDLTESKKYKKGVLADCHRAADGPKQHGPKHPIMDSADLSVISSPRSRLWGEIVKKTVREGTSLKSKSAPLRGEARCGRSPWPIAVADRRGRSL